MIWNNIHEQKICWFQIKFQSEDLIPKQLLHHHFYHLYRFFFGRFMIGALSYEDGIIPRGFKKIIGFSVCVCIAMPYIGFLM